MVANENAVAPMDRDEFLSIALATNQSESLVLPTPPLVTTDLEYGVKLNSQTIEEDFSAKYGFANVKKSKKLKKREEKKVDHS